MLAREVMTHPAVCVPADMACTTAAQLLVDHGFTGAPVVDGDGTLVGVVTEAGLLRGRIPTDPRRGDPHHTARFGAQPGRTVAAVMTMPAESLAPGTDIADAARIMLDRGIRMMPVVDGIAVVGVLSRRDVLRAAVAHTDLELQALITHRLAALDHRQRWDVSVQAGVADITDHVDSPRDRRNAEHVADGVPGVVHAEARYLTSDPF